MIIHESSVNFKNLIRDLAEMYPFEIADVVVVELIANALDAGANSISIDFDHDKKVLIVKDNGRGMNPTQFDEYHDFAAGLKARGTGIGFAGLGAKISFNIADRVLTETCSETFSGGSEWYLQSRKKLLWEEIQPTHLRGCGTRVEVHFRPDAVGSYSSTEHLVKLLRRHYFPLMDTKFLDLYEDMNFYSSGLRFTVNGKIIRPSQVAVDLGLDKVKEFVPRRAGKRFGYGILGLADDEYPIALDICGVLLCTRGKVIKGDLFNQFPGALGPQIFGIIEIPDFVKFLTTAKTDFIRTGRHKEFERLYDPIRQEFKAWLQDLGLEATEILDTDEAKKLERELNKLVEEVPELRDFFGFRSRKNVLGPSETDLVSASTQEGEKSTFPFGKGNKGEEPGPVDEGNEPGEALVEDQNGTQKARPISRTARRGLKVTFAEIPDEMKLAWIEGNTVVINTGHPSYAKTRSNSLARRLHSFFSIASAIQKFLASESSPPDMMFVDRMMAAWGKK